MGAKGIRLSKRLCIYINYKLIQGKYEGEWLIAILKK
jgi:hypothetical protein